MLGLMSSIDEFSFKSKIGRMITLLTTFASRLSGFLTLAFMLAVLSGCGAKTIVLEGDYPSPLVGKLPLVLGVYFDPSLQDFTYIETNENSGKDQYIISSGETQQLMFQTLLPSLFNQVVELESLENVPGDYPEIDAVFVPVIDDFQLGLPQKTRLNSYEIWIKYNMRLSEPDGTNIADWVRTAYGKAPKELSSANAINQAANNALRDLAASMALGFENVPDIQDWLSARGYIE